jgi:hypothetical protein
MTADSGRMTDNSEIGDCGQPAMSKLGPSEIVDQLLRWLLDGSAPEEVGDLYSKLKEDFAFRQEWAERIGLGFELVHNGPQNAEELKKEKVA